MANVKITEAQIGSIVTAINNRAKTSDMTTALADKVDTSLLGQANGVATLDSDGLIPLSQLPADIGNGEATFTETNITATAGQTVFNATYSVGSVEVYMNGVKMTSGVDFTATNGTSITLASGAAVGDEVSVLAYSTFAVADTYTKSETDSKFANFTSDSLKDVTITSPADGQALVYETSTQLWKNKSASDTKLSTDGNSIVKTSNSGTIKNQCTSWVNFDGSTTPPTIRDSYNVSSVVRSAAGVYDIYFVNGMDNNNYSISIASSKSVSWTNTGDQSNVKNLSRVQVSHVENGVTTNTNGIEVHVFGGKN